MKRRAPPIWICLGLALVTFAVFAPTLHHEFLDYDDQQYVTENPHVLAGLTWPSVTWAFKSFYASNWHPLTWLSHMLDCQLYGLHPAGHHLSNALLHAANIVLLFLLLRSMTGALWRSATVAALFAWHPLHVESVAWIAERKDVLSGLFFMLTLLSYSRYADLRTKSADKNVGDTADRDVCATLHASRSTLLRSSALTLLLFAIGLMSKPMLVSVPFILLLLDYWPLQRFRWPLPPVRLLLEKMPFLILSAVCAVVTILAQGKSHSLVSSAALPFAARFGHALLAYIHYLGVMFVPRHLAVSYLYQERVGSTSEMLLAAVVLLLITALAFTQASRRPYLLVGWLWYLVTLIPVIGFVQVGDQAWADRYTYLPLIGPFIVLVWGAAELIEVLQSSKSLPGREESDYTGAQALACSKPGRSPRNGPSGGVREFLQAKARAPSLSGVAQTAIAIIAFTICAVMVVATSLQIRYWRNTRTLFEHALQVTPRNARALAVLGSLLAKEGKIPEAKELYRQALVYRPDDPEAHFFMGVALAHENRFDEALTEYNQVLWFKPLEAKAHLFMGVALAKQQKYDEAAAQYQAVLALEPDSAVAHNDLARALHSQGRLNEAMEQYAAALKADPNLAEARNNFGVFLLQIGRTDEGAVQLRKAVDLNPADTQSRYNLAVALNQLQKWTESEEILARLEPAHSQNPDLQYQFALALARVGKTRDAMSHYAKALLLRQDFPEALEGLAWILSTDPHPEFRNADQAVAMAERACELTARKEPSALMTLAAAYAEAGRYANAVAAAQDALALAETSGRNEVATKCRALVSAARAGKAWREGVKEN